MASKSRPNRPKRRWWQLLLRGLVLMLLILGAAYVTLPWWAPTGFIRDRIARQLAEQMGVEVTIGELSMSWVGGVELKDLRIHSDPRFGPQPMIEVPHLRADLSPIDFLLRKRLAWMEIQEPRVFVKIDDRGNVNLAPLSKLSSDVTTERISVHRATAIVDFPAYECNLAIHVADLQYIEGELDKFGRMTMSAELSQTGGAAPVGLHVAGTSADSPVEANAEFSFSGVDLHQLEVPLARLLGLPLKRLAGRCGGSIKLQIKSDAVVEEFTVSLTIRRLEVQPKAGPELPVIEKAGFRVEARWDPFPAEAGTLTLRHAEVHLPGLDLSGQANLFTGGGMGWQAIKSMDFSGQVHPGDLAALLTGRARLPGDLRVDRRIQVKVSAGGGDEPAEKVLPLRMSFDATHAKVSAGERTLKPAATTLRGEVTARVDRTDWTVRIRGGKLFIGDNELAGHGELRDLRTLTKRWGKKGFKPSLRSIVADLDHMQWDGRWEIRDLPALEPLIGALTHVKLRGRINGGWTFNPHGRHLVEADVNVPADTELRIAGQFVKPPGKSLSVTLGGSLDADRAAVTDLWGDLRVATGRLSLSRGFVQMLPAGSGPAAALMADLGGRFDAEAVEELLACVPAWSGPGSETMPKLRGGIEGRYWLRVAPGLRTGEIACDLTDLAADWQRYLHKAPGSRAALEIDLASDDAVTRDNLRLDATYHCDRADLTTHVRFRWAGKHPPEIAASAALAVKDARWLTRTSGFLSDRLAAEKLLGQVTLDGSAAWSPRALECNLRLGATDLEYRSKGPLGRWKRRGDTLEAWLRGSLRARADGTVSARLSSAAVRLGGSRLDLSGWADLRPGDPQGRIVLYPPPNVSAFDARLALAAALDEPARLLLPELAAPADRHAVGGALHLVARARGDRESASLRVNVNADKLSATRLGAFKVIQRVKDRTAGRDVEKVRERFAGRPVKPAGLPARMDLEVTYARRPAARLVLNSLHVRLGDVELLAGGSVGVRDTGETIPVDLAESSGHVAFSCRRAEGLTAILPELAPFRLAGQAQVELEWKDTGPTRLRYVKFNSSGIQGRYRGQTVRLAGGLLLGDVRLPEKPPAQATPAEKPTAKAPSDPAVTIIDVTDQGPPAAVGRVRTEGLVFQLADSRGWIVADIHGLPDKPRGTFLLSAKSLDAPQLVDLLAGPAPEEPSKSLTLTAARTAEVEAEANKTIEEILPVALASEVTGKAHIDRLRTFDAAVQRHFVTRHMKADVSLDRGRVHVEYVGGLNGGTYRRTLAVDLSKPSPVVDSVIVLDKVGASEPLQRQLALFFPGNVYKGLFTRTEKVKIAFPRFVAASLDTRYPLRPVGSAEAETTDGVIKGQAVPTVMTKIFPSLKKTEYKYRKMVSFAKFLPDGSAKNEMIFNGESYDLHIAGSTDANNIGTYMVSLLPIGAPTEGDPARRPRPVSIPLVRMTARIEGGEMHDLKFSYLINLETPRDIFIRNNINIARNLLDGAYRVFMLARQGIGLKPAEKKTPPKKP